MEKCEKTLKFKDLVMFAEEIAAYDTRKERCQKHAGRTIVFTALCAIICGFREWDSISMFGRKRKALMEEYLGPLESTPSADTIARFFAVVKPECLEGVFRIWMNEIFRLRKMPSDEKPRKEIISIDGKEICGTSSLENNPLRIVSAYSSTAGVSLGQETVGEKTNEIPAARKLVECLDVRGTLITAGTLHCQKETCQAVVENGADFFLFVKGNQKFLAQAVQNALDTALNSPCYKPYARYRTQSAKKYEGKPDKDFCIRTCVALSDLDLLGDIRKEWPWVKSFGVTSVEKEDKETGGIAKEDRYFISSHAADASLFLRTAREHWGVENGLHWRLDVDFKEDDSRKRRNAAINFSLLCKMAMAILGTDKKKRTMKSKRYEALLDENYFRGLLDNFAMQIHSQ